MAQPVGVRMGIEPGTPLTGADEEMPWCTFLQVHSVLSKYIFNNGIKSDIK